MSTKLKLALGLTAIAVAAGAGGAVALELDGDAEVAPIEISTPAAGPAAASDRRANEPDDADDQPLAPTEVDRVSAAALRVTGGGTVTELDRSDDPGETYEVEVVKDGREIDLAFDATFRRVPNRRYEE